MSIRKQDALRYHEFPRPGKIEVTPTKPFATSLDLSLAYTPGVAEPCKEIQKDPDAVAKYTARQNLVAVLSNGTAVLGLGNIGPLAGKPVMEGKGVLFKKFAGIDVFDIEVDALDVETFCTVAKALEPTFGGINLEDIAAPECFEIEERLRKEMGIPVFHDDQHGTAIISAAALVNALELVHKRIEDVRVVVSGAGAAAVACANLYVSLGVRLENVLMVDSRGVIYEGRTERMNRYKEKFARPTAARTLADAMKGADVFIGVSAAGVLKKEMVASMADNPIVFAMANPDPEITWEDATSVRTDVIMATGRSDYPNQVNNVLGFPFIFRGALDVWATAITEEMKKAAVMALAKLAREEVPKRVMAAYGNRALKYGREYIIPKPFDKRVLTRVAPAVARAAIESGVARRPIEDWGAYNTRLEALLDPSQEVMRDIIRKAKTAPKRIVFPEGDDITILRACEVLVAEGIARPVLLGSQAEIRAAIASHDIRLEEVEIIDPGESAAFDGYVQTHYETRQRKGLTLARARTEMKRRTTYAMMMVHTGDADGCVSGLSKAYPDTIRPALQIVGVQDGVHRVSGMYMVVQRNRVHFFADTTVNVDPTAEELAEIAVNVADTVKGLDIEPRVAMLSFSNFGSAPYPQSVKVAKATALVRERRPDLVVDGEMQVDIALDAESRAEAYPFSTLEGEANVFIFPDLNSGNIGYKLMKHLAGAEIVGPILMGMARPVNVLHREADVSNVVNMAAITVVKAQGDVYRF